MKKRLDKMYVRTLEDIEREEELILDFGTWGFFGRAPQAGGNYDFNK